VGNKHLHKVIDNGACAVREHFMFRSFAQQNGQYNRIKFSEFKLQLMKKSPTTGPNARAEGMVELSASLNQYTWNGDEAAIIESITEMVQINPTRYYLEIQRHPKQVDKRIRDKTHPWHPWKLPNQQCVCQIHHSLLHGPPPNDQQYGKTKKLGFNNTLAFFHTKNLTALAEGHLFHSKCSYFNFCAKQLSFATVEVNKGKATFWHHALTTDKMTKWENKEDYRWCENARLSMVQKLEAAATEIAFHMNILLKKIMDMYSTHYNHEQIPIARIGANLPELFGDNDDNNSWEGIDRDPTRSITDQK
jgi:hypothetical protein